MNNKCKCGCKKIIPFKDKRGRNIFYVKGHFWRGKKLTEEHKIKLKKNKLKLYKEKGNIIGFQQENKLGENKKSIKTRFKKGNLSFLKNKKIWKGSIEEYRKLHYWVKKNKPSKVKCNKCGSLNRELVWANISQRYLKKISDWECLCRSCHSLKDLKFIKEKYEEK